MFTKYVNVWYKILFQIYEHITKISLLSWIIWTTIKWFEFHGDGCTPSRYVRGMLWATFQTHKCHNPQGRLFVCFNISMKWNRLFRHKSKPLCGEFTVGNSPVTCEFPQKWPIKRKKSSHLMTSSWIAEDLSNLPVTRGVFPYKLKTWKAYQLTKNNTWMWIITDHCHSYLFFSTTL